MPAAPLEATELARWRGLISDLADEKVRVHQPPVITGLRLAAPSPVVAVDLDSTVFPLIDAIAALPGNEGFGMHEVDDWDYLIGRFGGLESMLATLGQAMRAEHALRVPPFAGAGEVLERLVARHNARLVVMTDRPPGLAPDTLAYLAHHRIPSAAVLCGRLADKVALCDLLGAGTIIDDRPSTLETAHRAGLQALTLAHPYNETARAAIGLDALADWAQLEERLDAVLSRS